MKIEGNTLRPGNIVEHLKSLWTVVSVDHVKPGKGGAFAQVELKNVYDGSKLNTRFRSSESVERVYLVEKEALFLFASNDELTFMDKETYEQVLLNKSFLGPKAVFLKENMTVVILSYEDKPVSITLPDRVVLTVAETEPTIKGQTATSSYKPSMTQEGIRVMVPPFIGVGERIIVSTRDSSYEGRDTSS